MEDSAVRRFNCHLCCVIGPLIARRVLNGHGMPIFRQHHAIATQKQADHNVPISRRGGRYGVKDRHHGLLVVANHGSEPFRLTMLAACGRCLRADAGSEGQRKHAGGDNEAQKKRPCGS